MTQATRLSPPRFVPISASEYIVFRYEAPWFDVAYYRPYKLGEDGIRTAEDAARIHKRFAISKRSLLDALRVVFAEGECELDADLTAWHIRTTQRGAKLPEEPKRAPE